MPAPSSLRPAASPLWRRCGLFADRSWSPKPLSVALAVQPCGRPAGYVTRAKADRMIRAEMRKQDLAAYEAGSPEAKLSMAERQKLGSQLALKQKGPLLPPGTFVKAPFSEMPKSPLKFLRYQWSSFYYWFAFSTQILLYKLRSMSKWTSRPQLQLRSNQIVPTAKTIYREAMEAFADGDKDAIRRLCFPHFAESLIRGIERRPPRERLNFQITKYNKPLFYPRLRSHRIEPQASLSQFEWQELAVVAIASTQVVSKQDRDTGAVIPGTVKMQDSVENVVVMRDVNPETWRTTEWKLWGTMPHTDLDVFNGAMAKSTAEFARSAGMKQTGKM